MLLAVHTVFPVTELDAHELMTSKPVNTGVGIPAGSIGTTCTPVNEVDQEPLGT